MAYPLIAALTSVPSKYEGNIHEKIVDFWCINIHMINHRNLLHVLICHTLCIHSIAFGSQGIPGFIKIRDSSHKQSRTTHFVNCQSHKLMSGLVLVRGTR